MEKKFCNHCKTYKSKREFYARGWCKSCQKEWSKGQADNKYFKRRHNHFACEWVGWLQKHGFGIPSYFWDYHHIRKWEKSFSVGTWISNHPITKKNIKILRAELRKCVFISRGEHARIHLSGRWKDPFL